MLFTSEWHSVSLFVMVGTSYSCTQSFCSYISCRTVHTVLPQCDCQDNSDEGELVNSLGLVGYEVQRLHKLMIRNASSER